MVPQPIGSEISWSIGIFLFGLSVAFIVIHVMFDVVITTNNVPIYILIIPVAGFLVYLYHTWKKF